MKPEKELTRAWGEQMTPDKLIPAFILQGSVSRYIWAGQYVAGKDVLDVGCGSGYGAKYFKNKGARSVTGSDTSSESVAYAEKRYPDDDLKFVVVDAERMPFHDGSFDIVTSFEVIEHVEHYENYLSECFRVLKDDGLFICSTPNAKIGSDNGKPLARYHHKEFYADEFYGVVSRYSPDVEVLGMDPQQSGDKLVYRLATFLQTFIFKIPKVHIFTNMVTTFVFKKYRLLRMGDSDRDIARVAVKRLLPYTLTGNYPMPGDLIAIGKGKR